MKPLTGIIMAMPAEARVVLGRRHWQRRADYRVRRSAAGERPQSICVCAGLGPKRAEAACRYLISQGATSLLVLGMAGGLHPGLRPGELVVADAAVEVDTAGAGRVISADTDQARQTYAALITAGFGVRLGRVVTVPQPVRSAAEKFDLRKRYNALTVDMESGAVLQTARAAGLPVCILRAVCDPADRGLTEPVAQGVTASGRRRPVYILRKLLADPALLPALWQAKEEMAAALKSLRSAWRSAPFLIDRCV